MLTEESGMIRGVSSTATGCIRGFSVFKIGAQRTTSSVNAAALEFVLSLLQVYSFIATTYRDLRH